MFGHYPAAVLHDVLGTGISAHVLAYVYMTFLLFVPLSLGAALVWSKNVATGFWYVTALCVNWVLGAASYYWLPSLGPSSAASTTCSSTCRTPRVTQLQHALRSPGATSTLADPHATDSVQSDRRVRVAARVDHLHRRPDLPLRHPEPGGPLDDVGLLRAHRDVDGLLRLALPA